MPVTITEDIIGGAKYNQNKDGGTLTRVFTVEGLTQTTGDNVVVATIVQDSATGKRIPAYGQAHPQVAGLSVSNIACTPLMKNARTAVRVEVTYVSQQINPSGSFVKVEITGTNGTKTFNRWPVGSTPGGTLDGEIMIIPYSKNGQKFQVPIDPKTIKPPAAAAGGVVGAVGQVVAGLGAQIFYDYASFSILSPNTMLTFTRQRIVTPATGTLGLSQKFRRRVNQVVWNGGDDGEWLCRNITSTLLGILAPSPGAPANQLYEERFEFEWDPDGWNSDVALFKSSINGQPPSGISVQSGTNNGYLKFDGYDYVDFNALGLPPVF